MLCVVYQKFLLPGEPQKCMSVMFYVLVVNTFIPSIIRCVTNPCQSYRFNFHFYFFLCVHVFLLCCNAFLQCSLHLYHANLFVMMIMMMMLIAVPN